MKHHQTALNLIVIDFESLADDIQTSFLNKIRIDYGTFEEDIPERDRKRILQYFILKHTLKAHNSFANSKNVIFYINQRLSTYESIKKCFLTISKPFNLMVYTNSIDFDCINSKSGDSIELLTGLKNFRFNFDHGQFSYRKVTLFLEKNKLDPARISEEIPEIYNYIIRSRRTQ